MNSPSAPLQGAIPQVLSQDFFSVFTAHVSGDDSFRLLKRYSELSSAAADSYSYDELFWAIGDYAVSAQSIPQTFTLSEATTFFLVSGSALYEHDSNLLTLDAGMFVRLPAGEYTFYPITDSFFCVTASYVPPVYYDPRLDVICALRGHCYIRWFASWCDFDFLFTLASLHGKYPRVSDIYSVLLNHPNLPSDLHIEIPHIKAGNLHLSGSGPKVPVLCLQLTNPSAAIGGDESLSFDNTDFLDVSTVDTLTKCVVRLNPESDKILNMLGFDSDKAKSDAIKVLYTDKNSHMRRAIDQNIAEKITDAVDSKKFNRRRVVISQLLSPEQERTLESHYPEFDITFKSNHLHPHPMAAASRKLETELTLMNFNYSLNSRPPRGYHACVVDIGGNWSSHMLAKRKYIHSCCPILSAYDDLRNSVRMNIVNSYTLPEGPKHQALRDIFKTYRDRSTRCRIVCKRKAEDCLVKAPYLMAIHSLYDMSHEAIGDAMVAHGADVLAGSLIFVPEIFLGGNGLISDLNCEFNVNVAKDEIEFFFRDDHAYNYAHKYSQYKNFFRLMVFQDSRKRHTFYTQLGTNRLGVQFFTIHRSSNPTVPRSAIRHRLYMESMKDKIVVRYYDFNVKATSTRVAMVPHTFLAPKMLYDKIFQWAVRFPDSKFSVFETFNYACSVNNRQVHGGVSITTNCAVDPLTLMKLSHAVYLQAYSLRYNMGKVDKNVIESIKFDRELGEGGVASKVWLILKGAVRTAFPKGKLSSILSLWVLNPDRFDVTLADAVKVFSFEQWVQKDMVPDDKHEPYNFITEEVDPNPEADVVVEFVDEEQENGSVVRKQVTVAKAREPPAPYIEPALPSITDLYCAYENTVWFMNMNESYYGYFNRPHNSNARFFETMDDAVAYVAATMQSKKGTTYRIGKVVDPTQQIFERRGTEIVCTADEEQIKRIALIDLKGFDRTGGCVASWDVGSLPYLGLCKYSIELPFLKTVSVPLPTIVPTTTRFDGLPKISFLPSDDPLAENRKVCVGPISFASVKNSAAAWGGKMMSFARTKKHCNTEQACTQLRKPLLEDGDVETSSNAPTVEMATVSYSAPIPEAPPVPPRHVKKIDRDTTLHEPLLSTLATDTAQVQTPETQQTTVDTSADIPTDIKPTQHIVDDTCNTAAEEHVEKHESDDAVLCVDVQPSEEENLSSPLPVSPVTPPKPVRTKLETCCCTRHYKVEVPGDGSCFYWAVASHLGADSQQDIRDAIIRSDIRSAHAAQAKHIARIPNAWAEENTVKFVSEIYDCTLCIHEQDEESATIAKIVNPGRPLKWCFAQEITHISPLRCMRSASNTGVEVDEIVEKEHSSQTSEVETHTPAEEPTMCADGDTDKNPDRDAIDNPVDAELETTQTETHHDRIEPKLLSNNPTLKKTGIYGGPLSSEFQKLSPLQKRLWGDFSPAFVSTHHRLSADYINASLEVLEYWRIYTQRLHQDTADLMATLDLKNKNTLSALRLDQKGVGVYDMHARKWIVQPPKGEVYAWGHDGDTLLKLPRRLFKVSAEENDEELETDARLTIEKFQKAWEEKGTRRKPYIYTSADFRLLQESNLYTTLMHRAYLDDLKTDIKFEFVNGVPGCGKTTYILENHKKSIMQRSGKTEVMLQKGDLVLTNTREGAADIKRRLQAMGCTATRRQYRTMDSFLLNSEDKWDTVWFDEALMSHFGTILLACAKAHCSRAVLIGDKNQIPFIGRLSGIELRYRDASKFLPITRELSISYRCPVDVAATLSSLYPSGMKSASKTRNSMSFKSIDNLRDVPKRPDVQYLTFRQQEKRQLKLEGYNLVNTIHEFQGNQSDVVYIVRLSRKPQDLIYSSLEHVTVALSRHRREMVYFSPIAVDELHKRVSKIPAARDMQMASTEIDVPYTKLSFGWAAETPEIIVRPVVQPRMQPLINLQTWYDSMLPEDSTEDQSADHSQVLTSDVHFEVGLHETRPGKLGPIKDLRPTLQPKLRTGCAPPRQKAMRETVLAYSKRNANVPELSGVIHTTRMADEVFKLFCETYLIEDYETDCRVFRQSPLIPSSTAVEEWLRTQNPNVQSAIVGDATAIWDKPLNEYSFMNKREVKPALDGTATKEYKPSQTIAFSTKDINAIFSPIFREAMARLKAVLKNHFLIFAGDSLEEYAKKITTVCPPSLARGLFAKEIDFSKYDKSQGELHLRIEMRIFELLGLPSDYLTYWYAAHYYTQVNDYTGGFKAWMLYQRKSGDAATFLGNTLICMAMLSSLYDMEKCALGLFAGDDSLVLGPQVILEKNMEYEAAVIFNMESKFFNYNTHYFCSKFLLAVDDKWILVPDVLKLVFKLGRKDLVSWEHATEYWTSLKDLLKPLLDANINDPLSAALNERYKSTNSDHTYVFGAIASLLDSREEFLSLFEEPAGGLLKDPSRPLLDF